MPTTEDTAMANNPTHTGWNSYQDYASSSADRETLLQNAEMMEEAEEEAKRADYPLCRAIAEKLRDRFIYANGAEYVKQYGLDLDREEAQQCWHEWLTDELSNTMKQAIEEGASYTGIDFIYHRMNQLNLPTGEAA